MRMSHIATIITVAAIGVACATGNNNDPDTTTETTTSDTTPNGQLGDTITITNYVGEPVVDITVSNLTTDVTSNSVAIEAVNGAYTTIMVEASFHDTTVFGASAFTIVAADGQAVNSKAIVPGIEDQVQFSTYRNGQTTKGVVVFDVDTTILDNARIEYGTRDLEAYWDL